MSERTYDEHLAARRRDATGNPVCDCGAPLTHADGFFCEACSEANAARAKREREERLRSEELERLKFGARRGLREAPDWPHARVGTEAFQRAVKSDRFRAVAAKYEPDRDGTLTLCGETGRGKTTVALAILRRLHDEALADPHPAKLKLIGFSKWVTSYRLVEARREHPLGRGKAELVEAAINATLLVIDDLGNEPPDPVTFEVIDERYAKSRPIIVTTGFEPKALRAKHGDAIWRRLTERGIVVDAKDAKA